MDWGLLLLDCKYVPYETVLHLFTNWFNWFSNQHKYKLKNISWVTRKLADFKLNLQRIFKHFRVLPKIVFEDFLILTFQRLWENRKKLFDHFSQFLNISKEFPKIIRIFSKNYTIYKNIQNLLKIFQFIAIRIWPGTNDLGLGPWVCNAG